MTTGSRAPRSRPASAAPTAEEWLGRARGRTVVVRFARFPCRYGRVPRFARPRARRGARSWRACSFLGFPSRGASRGPARRRPRAGGLCSPARRARGRYSATSGRFVGVVFQGDPHGRRAPQGGFAAALRRAVWRREVTPLDHVVKGATAATTEGFTDAAPTKKWIEFVEHGCFSGRIESSQKSMRREAATHAEKSLFPVARLQAPGFRGLAA